MRVENLRQHHWILLHAWIVVASLLLLLGCRGGENSRNIQSKVETIERLLPGWGAAGGNPETIGSRMQRFQELMRSGKPREAEALLDEVLTLLKEPGQAKLAEAPGKDIQSKVETIERLLPGWVAAGGNPETIGSRMQKVQELMRSGNPREAEALVDEVLATLQSPSREASEKKQITGKSSAKGPHITTPRALKLGPVPADAAIVFHKPTAAGAGKGEEIFVMNKDGGNVAQITFNHPQHYEHVAVSRDRTRIAANRWLTGPDGRPERSTLWVLDLKRQVESQITLYAAGDGGIDWDREGFIYFAGREESGAGQHVYKIRYDGTGLAQLTSGAQAVDVGLSADGTMVAYLRVVPQKLASGIVPIYQVWVMNTDGKNNRMVFDGGHVNPRNKNQRYGAADPTPSPDKKQVVFSMENPNFRNYPNVPGLNTAHDLYVITIEGTGLRRLTPEGAISIIPDWQDGRIVYTEISEKDNYQGISIITSDGTGKRRLGPGSIAKWIPRASDN